MLWEFKFNSEELPTDMRADFTIIGCIAIAMSGCAIKQELHSFPLEAKEMIQNESCNCEKIEFVETDSKISFDNGIVPRMKSEGYMRNEEGITEAYSYVKSALYVKEDRNLLSDIADAVVIGLLTETVGGNWHADKTFKGVRQTIDIQNPFDGEKYTLSATSDGRSAIVKIAQRVEDKLIPLGAVISPYSANFNERHYKLKVERQWGSHTYDKEEGGETIWHHYPDGAYMLLMINEEPKVKLFRGAVPGKTFGLASFTGYKSVVFVPKGTHPDIKRESFLFYYGVEFFHDFTDDVMALPECLNKSENDVPESCPPSIVME